MQSTLMLYIDIMVLARRHKHDDRIEYTTAAGCSDAMEQIQVHGDDTKKRPWTATFLDTITIRSDLFKCFIAECYGTFLMAALTRGAVAQDTVSRTGSTFNISITIGLSLMFSIYSAFGVSGGHINPSISIGLAAGGSFPWKRVPTYFIAQLIGGFVGAAVVYGIYQETFDDFDGGTRQAFGENGTAGIFATFPKPCLSITTGFLEQVFNTGLMLALTLAVTDQKNSAPPSYLQPVLFGLSVFIILMGYSFNAGSPLNPSLDLSGRTLLAVAGYGKEVWTPGGVHWWWIPILGPATGSALGSWSYILAIRLHHHQPSKESTISGIEDSLEFENCNPVSQSQHIGIEVAKDNPRTSLCSETTV